MTWQRWIGIGSAIGAASVPLLAADRLNRRKPPVIREGERSQSYWMQTIPELPRFPFVDENIRVDVAVVGGGFTGLALAYYIKQIDPSLRVAVLESHRFGSGASSRNSGAATPYFSSGKTDASQRGFELLRAFCDRNNLDVDFKEAVSVMTLHRTLETCPDPDLSGDELARQIGSSYYEAATVGETNRLHPGKLIAGLVQAAVGAGVELYEYAPVERIQQGTPHWLHTPHATVSANTVALATNAYTPGLGIAKDRIMALHHRVMVTRPLTDEEWQRSGLEMWPYRLEHGGIYNHSVRTTPDRRLFFRHVLGHRAFEQPDWTITDADRAIGQRELLRRYPWLEGITADYEWHGVTGHTRDLWPVSGEIDDRLFIAAGYSGPGIMTSHFFGHILAHAITGKALADRDLLSPTEEHPRMLGEFGRSLKLKAEIAWARRRDV